MNDTVYLRARAAPFSLRLRRADEREIGSDGPVKAGAQTLKALHLEALTQVLRPLERLLAVDGEFPQAHRQRLLCAKALVDRSFSVGQRFSRSSRLQLTCRGRIARHSEKGLFVQAPGAALGRSKALCAHVPLGANLSAASSIAMPTFRHQYLVRFPTLSLLFFKGAVGTLRERTTSSFHQPRISGRQRLYDLARREARRRWL